MGGMTDDWRESLAAVVVAGADAVEVGIPFSDPMMDGPVIQEAALRALQRGSVPDEVLDGIAGSEVPVPVAIMTYYNLVFRAATAAWHARMAAAGVTGAIVPTSQSRSSRHGRRRPTQPESTPCCSSPRRAHPAVSSGSAAGPADSSTRWPGWA